MALDERHTRKISEDAGIKDVHGRPRMLATSIQDDTVVLSDGRGWWVHMPVSVANKLGMYLITTAAEVEQQQGRRS